MATAGFVLGIIACVWGVVSIILYATGVLSSTPTSTEPQVQSSAWSPPASCWTSSRHSATRKPWWPVEESGVLRVRAETR